MPELPLEYANKDSLQNIQNFKKRRKIIKRILMGSAIELCIILGAVGILTNKNYNLQTNNLNEYLTKRSERLLWDVYSKPSSLELELSHEHTMDVFRISLEDKKIVLRRTTLNGPFYIPRFPPFFISHQQYEFP